MNDSAIKNRIIQSIKNTFDLDDNFDFNCLSISDKARNIAGFHVLLMTLSDDKTPPKIIATALEQVILQIKLKDEATSYEKRFYQRIKALIYDQQYVTSDDENQAGAPSFRP